MAFVKNEDKVLLVLEGEVANAMRENTTDGALEKHVPVVTFDGDTMHVEVGSVHHPMTEPHYIGFIYVETKDGGMYKTLDHTGEPVADFKVAKEDVVAVYEYCNLHGIWKVAVE